MANCFGSPLIDLSCISGDCALSFMNHFDYIREAGTDGAKKAAKEIVSQLNELTLKPKTESFSFDETKILEASLTVKAPFEKSFPVAGYTHGGDTPDEGITAPLYYAEYGDPISLSKAAGCIVLLSIPVGPALYDRLVKAGALGFISVAGTPIDGGIDRAVQNRRLPVKNKQGAIPGLVIHYNDALELLNRQSETVTIKLKSETLTKTGTNISVTINGTDKAEESLVFCAHYDSVPAGKGAYDNLAGAGIVYELCRCFASLSGTENAPRRTLKFIWFDAEEKGLLGSKAYCSKHKKDLESCRMVLNTDLAGQLIGGTVFGVTASEEVEKALLLFSAEAGIGLGTKRQVWSSDSNSFAALGIPAVTLDRDGFGMHTRFDTLSLISPWALSRDARLLYYIGSRLDDSEVFPLERAVPDEFLQVLNKK